MARNPPNLFRRHQTWWARKAVPTNLQKDLGKALLRQSLKTQSLTEAKKRLPAVLAQWETMFAAMRSDDPLRREAAVWRQTLQEYQESDRRLLEDDRDAVTQKELAADHAQENLAKRYGPEKAREWFSMVTGQTVELETVAEEWLAQSSYASQSVTMHRQAIRLLVEQHKTAESVTRRRAAQFLREILLPGRSPTTVTRMKSTYGQLWKWMRRTGVYEGDDPWRDQDLNGGGRKQAEAKTPREGFTEDEGAAMLTTIDAHGHKHPADPVIARLAAVTGCRIGELCGLKVGDLEPLDPKHGGGVWLRIRSGKTNAARRRVPVLDQEAVSAVRQWAKALPDPKDTEAPLWPTLKADKHGSLSRAMSKRWGRWMREALKPREGLVAAHAWRHRARPLMERAKVRAAAQDAFLGHKGPGVGWGTYYSPSEEELMEAARAMYPPKGSR